MSNIIVQTLSADETKAKLFIENQAFDCALGPNGVTVEKKEGDGKTPVGTYALRYLFYRSDRLPKPETGLEARELTPDLGWSDDAGASDYNCLVTLPYAGSHEKMMRDDDIYDLVAVIGYNDNPPVAGKGSAIFMHVARPGLAPTAGCIALMKDDLLQVLKHCDAESTITILPPPKG
jgi:L,D-peptidoglycan transpeptidase YkuD (ErfK/YbiS/YcfS/YnhG family)